MSIIDRARDALNKAEFRPSETFPEVMVCDTGPLSEGAEDFATAVVRAADLADSFARSADEARMFGNVAEASILDEVVNCIRDALEGIEE